MVCMAGDFIYGAFDGGLSYMKTINVSLKENSYRIFIGQNTLGKLGAYLKTLRLGKDAVVITTSNIRRLHGKALVAGLERNGFSVKVFEVPDGERSKSAKYAFKLMEQIARYDILKNVFIVAFGGGVIGDLAGYVAAAYKRGIPYVQVPTTFLAQIDSAIGGKVAIDLPVGKNLVGAFHQPKVVWSDVALLTTLSRRQLRNGMAEAVKYGVIADQRLFYYLFRNYNMVLDADKKVLEEVVVQCSHIKTNVVLKDEKETKGIRTILNFGHTVGHAIEAAGGFSYYHHGEAIALGMRVAADISCQMRIFNNADAALLNTLLTNIGLPQVIQKVKTQDILRLMQHDKKFVAGRNRFVLAQRIGKVKVVEGVKTDVITSAIRRYKS